MDENKAVKRREWVKNAAIIFLTIMLILTFFSNTIMNYSLPEVATQYVQSGTISAKVRGTGNIEATDPYNIVAKETRTISSVAVKEGDEVKKDQVIYYLEEKDSDELKKAEDELEELELTYMKGLFGENVSAEIIGKVASGKVDGFNALKNKVADIQKRIDDAEVRIKECKENVNSITLKSTINTNDAKVNTIPETTEKNLAEDKVKEIKAELLSDIYSSKNEISNQIADLETIIQNTEEGDVEASPMPDYDQQKTFAKNVLTSALQKIREAIVDDPQGGSEYDNPNYGIDDFLKWINKTEGKIKDYQPLLAEYYNAETRYTDIVNGQNNMIGFKTNKQKLEELESKLDDLNIQEKEINDLDFQSDEDYHKAVKRLNQAINNLNDKKNSNDQNSAAYDNKLANANAALKNAEDVKTLLDEEQKTLLADINAELTLSKTSKDIAEKEEEIAKLKEKSMGASITSPMDGIITKLSYVAGESTKPEEAAAILQVAGKGFTLKISVTSEQAKKVKIGDVAELQNAWYFDDDVKATLSGIKPDPDNSGSKKLLIFDVTGTQIQAGQSLSVALGQKSAEHELVVPNSAIREDNNGKFILIVESKSSPLGNRYIATRVDVQVVASDDNNTAINAPLYGYEYVITTSTKPVEAGKQVRLNES